MFNVSVYKTIWNKERREVDDILDNQSDSNNELHPTAYFYDVTLDFPPFINLELRSGSSGIWSSGQIKRVEWNIDENRFYCFTDDEYPHGSGFDYLDEDFLKRKCLLYGWKPLTLKDTP